MKHILKTKSWMTLLLIVSLTIPSLGIVQRLVRLITPLMVPSLVASLNWLEVAILTIYVVMVTINVIIIQKYLLVWFCTTITERQVIWLFLLTMTVLIVGFAYLYPILSSGRFGGGSDRDEALNIAVVELLNGRYPYYLKTFVPGLPHQLGLDGNPISPLPGELLFALPFVILGNGAYQNFFWLLVFFVTTKKYLQDGRQALLLLWSLLLLSPVCLSEIMTGGDLLANNLWIVIFLLLLITTGNHKPVLRYAILVVLLGIGLSSRPHYLLLVPLIYSMFLTQWGWYQSTFYFILLTSAFMLVTFPFYFYDLTGFSPLHVYNKLAQFDPVLPFAGIVIPLMTGVVSSLLACRSMNDVSFLKNCAIVQAIPVVTAVILSSIQRSQVNFIDFSWYGLNFLFLAVLALWQERTKTVQRELSD
jgi:hypothetical protein